MTQSLTKPATYSAALDALRHSRGQASPQWLADLGDQAWARFTELGFPTARRGNEKWKYTNVAPIARAAFGYAWDLDPDEDPAAGRLRHFGLLDEAWINLVFVDGRFSGSLSSRPETAKGVTVTSLAEAVSRDGEIVQRHLAEYAGFQDDGFTALNTAFLSDGAFVHVPRNHSSVPPVHLVFLTTNRELPRAVHPRTLIVVEENAALSVVETYAGPSNEQYFTNAVTEISVGDGSRVEHHRLSLEGANSYHVGFGRVRQGRDSSFSSVSLALGNTLGRNDFEVLLDGPGGSCALSGLYLTAEGQHVDNLIGIDHAKPSTSSRLNYKGILDGKSRAVFGGQVLVRKDAQKVNAQQTDKNLLLSDQAEIDSKPSLLIYADDVKCGHGATAGHVDQDSLFYLRSRGLSPDVAGRMLIHAFAREIIDSVSLEPLRESMEALFLDAIPARPLPFGGKS